MTQLSACHLPLPQGDLPAAYAWAEVDTDHVILETVKKAESENAWIVRVYESRQYHSNAVMINFGKPLRKVVECNLLEDDEAPITYQGHQLTFAIKPLKSKHSKSDLHVSRNG